MAFDTPIHSNEANLTRVLGAGLPVMLVLWQRNCAPCEMLAPALDRLARAWAGKALVVKVDAGDEPGVLSRFDVGALPALVFVKDGRGIATAIGAAGETELNGWLGYLVSGGMRPPTPSGPSTKVSKGPSPQSNGSGAQQSEPAGHPVVLTDATFEKTIKQSALPVLVDFWAAWCGPCKMIAPAVAELAREFAGKAVVAKVNVDENPDTAARFGVMSIPTLLIFKGGRVVDQIVGAQPAPVLRQRLARAIG